MVQALEYRPAALKRTRLVRALLLSALLGLAFNIIPVGILLIGAFDRHARAMGIAISTATFVSVAIVAGLMTIWTRRRREGAETLLAVLATYFVAATLVIFAAIAAEETNDEMWAYSRSLPFATWVNFGRELLSLLVYFELRAALFGLVLVPLTYICRAAVWKAYTPKLEPDVQLF